MAHENRTAGAYAPRLPGLTGSLRAITSRYLGAFLLLAGTAVLYLWNITVNQMGNSFYAGAVWAGTQNLKAWLFGSVDPNNYITVDKPPLSNWIMVLSGRLFGFTSASMLIPQAVMGVASVWLVYATLTRVAGRRAGMIGGAVLALTPVAALMFRYNNPDAAMVLLMTLALWLTVRAAEHASGWLLALAGVALGFAFLAKMLEGLMVLPALVVYYVLVASISWGRKLLHLVYAAVALVVSAGWYVLLTVLWPASARPYMAGSTDNSFLNLVFGYNGLSRVAGRGGAGPRGVGPGAAAAGERAGSSARGFAGMSGQTGPLRLFTGECGAEIAWLLPAALVSLIVIVVLRRGFPASDIVRALGISAGVWLLLDGAVLSEMQGTMHAYYTLAIAPAIALLVAIGAEFAWRQRSARFGRVALAGLVLAAGGWGFGLMRLQSPTWQPWIAWTVLTMTIVAVVGIVALPRFSSMRRFTIVPLVATFGLLSALGAPTAYTLHSVTVAHTGGSPLVNPVSGNDQGQRMGAAYSAGTRSDRSGGTGHGGGNRGESADNPALDQLLRSSNDEWAAAAPTTSAASSLELGSRRPVMGIGGFSGSDPAITLTQFQSDVRAGKIGYYVDAQAEEPGAGTGGQQHRIGGAREDRSSDGGDGFSRQNSTTTAIQQWVQQTFPARTVGGTTVFDLAQPKNA